MTKHRTTDEDTSDESAEVQETEVTTETAVEIEAPTSNDVGEQTSTKAGPPPTSADAEL